MVQEKLKILQLSPQFPFPMTDGGKIGIANIFKEYAASGHQITFCAYSDINIAAEYIAEAEKYGKIEIIRHSTRNTFKRILCSLFNKQSLYTSKHISDEAINQFEKIASASEFDVIHCDHSAMMPVALHLKNKFNIPIALRLHNIEWTIWYRYASVLNNFHPKKWYISSQGKKLKRDETEYYQAADVCFAITEEDKFRALDMSRNANVCVATAGVNIDEWNMVDVIEKNNNTMILATNYDWVHNVDGVIWFIENVLPLVQNIYPDAKLQLIGKNPPAIFNKYSGDGVEVLGFVPSVKEYLAKANVYIAPLFVGGGIRIKILEAMAMKLPVVATPVSAEGIKASDEDGLYVSDNVKTSAKYINQLFADKNLCQTKGNAARDFIKKQHTWKKSVSIMSTEIIKVITK